MRSALSDARLGLDCPGAQDAREARDELLGRIDDHLFARLDHLDAPLLAVVGGSTGAGKSTLVNLIAGERVSPAGVLRPTTRSPVIVCNPVDLAWFKDARILTNIPRSMGPAETDSAGQLHLVPLDSWPSGVALLDSPDIDSIEEANRTLAGQLLGAADLWLFVTTGARYADAVPWNYLRKAKQRGASLALVLNRIPVGATTELAEHLKHLIDEVQLDVAHLFSIEEGALTDPSRAFDAVEPVNQWIRGLARDADERARFVRTTLIGAVAAVPDDVVPVTRGLDEEARCATDELLEPVETAYRGAASRIAEGLVSGSVLRSEVLAQWRSIVGTELARSVRTGLGRARDRVRRVRQGRSAVSSRARDELESNLVSMIVAAADDAALRAATSWRATTAGRRLLERHGPGLERASEGLAERVGAEIRGWRGHLVSLVEEQGKSKRAVARALSLGVNTVGVALMVLVFASSGGMTGGEVVLGGGTAAVSRTFLAAIFGEHAVRELADSARKDLIDRIDRVLRDEAHRYRVQVGQVATDPDVAARLRNGAVRLDGALR